MAQFSKIVIVLASVISTLVAASSCHNGGIYCGFGLMQRGNYITKINTGLQAKHITRSDYHQKNSLWSCGDHGDIEFKQICEVGCFDNGTDDDACLENEAAEAAADAAEEVAVAAARKRDVGNVWVG
ncbi:hypothetical protein ONS95_011997 [Cadophora gregata]|uniref:uncharacterized protein n=1 Tax=Cadophora gregata TaxID=51156 RepID=UPI0026DD0DCF|nr:uncharacterized protein ONS95_011997 [Cadophora gregata]KAK0117668.1 hypothetical protein ONS95_011997 [Cadophora gregata]KAK0122717.1 hypothetical protein ONS96_009751 [Cadophora gregata f. sp. sojae]